MLTEGLRNEGTGNKAENKLDAKTVKVSNKAELVFVFTYGCYCVVEQG